MKKNLQIIKKILSFILGIIILFSIMPKTVFAELGNNWWQNLSDDLTNLSAQGSYTIKTDAQITNQDVLVFATKSGGTVDQTVGGNNWQTYTAYPYGNWAFSHWVTDYEGPSDKGPNFTYDGGTYYFSPSDNIKADGNGSSNETIRINKDYWAKGVFYIAAIFRPKVSIQSDVASNVQIRDMDVGFSSDSDGSVERYVTYKGSTTIAANIDTTSRILVSVTANGKNFNDYYFVDNALTADFSATEPMNFVITTRAKIQNVAFDANGGSGTMAIQNFNYGEEKSLTTNSFIRNGYAFTGWNTNANGSGISYSNNESVTFTPTKDGDSITLYAQWEKLPDAVITSAPTAKVLTYNTKAQNLVLEGNANGGIIMYSLEENGTYSEKVPTATDAGNYTVYYYVDGDSSHADSAKTSVKVEIKKANPVIGTVTANIVNNTTDISAVALKKSDNTVKGSFIIKDGQSLNLGDNDISYKFIPNDTSNYNSIEGTVKVSVVDTIPPSGTITFTDAKVIWDNVPESIVFEIFFKNDQKAVIEAADSFSGIQKIEYYETSDVLDLEGVKNINEDNWQIMSDDIIIIAEDAKQFIYYIRITDKSGNITYLATNGAEFDTTAPDISGVVNGKTYYSSQKVTITDKNLDTVTLNGKNVTKTTITLEGNKEAEYTIVATDKAGNTTIVTVMMAKLEDITDVNADTVIPEDKTELENAKNELENDLEENADIYTDEEKKAIEDKINEIEESLEVIKNIENVENLIKELPDKIKKSDINAIDVAKAAYDSLSDYEKTLIDSEIKKKLNNAIEVVKKDNNYSINLQAGDNITLYVGFLVISVIVILIVKKYTKK